MSPGSIFGFAKRIGHPQRSLSFSVVFALANSKAPRQPGRAGAAQRGLVGFSSALRAGGLFAGLHRRRPGKSHRHLLPKPCSGGNIGTRSMHKACPRRFQRCLKEAKAACGQCKSFFVLPAAVVALKAIFFACGTASGAKRISAPVSDLFGSSLASQSQALCHPSCWRSSLRRSSNSEQRGLIPQIRRLKPLDTLP